MSSLYDWGDLTKIGVGLSGLGVGFCFFGVMMLLDRAMLTLGNMLFLTGIVLIMKPDRCLRFFMDRRRWRFSLCFFVGIVLVMSGYCLIGIAVQGFGGLNLFGNFFPVVVRMLEALPVIGTILHLPFIAAAVDRITGSSRRNV